MKLGVHFLGVTLAVIKVLAMLKSCARYMQIVICSQQLLHRFSFSRCITSAYWCSLQVVDMEYQHIKWCSLVVKTFLGWASDTPEGVLAFPQWACAVEMLNAVPIE